MSSYWGPTFDFSSKTLPVTFSDPFKSYNLSFTGASLRPELARIVAEHYLATRDWEIARRSVLDQNALQSRTAKSNRVLETEIRQRVATLTDAQVVLLAEGNSDERDSMAWLAAAKRSGIGFDFAAEVLRAKLAEHDPVLRLSDYEDFISAKTPTHPELDGLAASTRGKTRQVLLSMLTEVGLLGAGRSERPVYRPVVSAAVTEAVVEDHPGWLAAFLVPDAEIER